jgi:hypothetical protein
MTHSVRRAEEEKHYEVTMLYDLHLETTVEYNQHDEAPEFCWSSPGFELIIME